MNIRSQLKIVIFLIILVSIIFTIIINSTLQNFQQAQQKTNIAKSIEVEVLQRRLLADEYLFYPGERPKSQWFAHQEKLNQLITLNQNRFYDPKEKELIANVNTGIKNSREVFQELVVLESEATSSTVLQKKASLTGQLSIDAQETIGAASGLTDINNKKAADSFQEAIGLFSGAIALFFLVLAASFLIIWKSASRLDQKKAEDEAILAGIGDGFIVTDGDGRISKVNQQAVLMLGFSREELTGQLITKSLRALDEDGSPIPADQWAATEALLTGRVISKRIYYLKKDGRRLPVSITVSPIVLEKKHIGAIELFRDITRETELEHLKDEFVSIASHELRTPMTAIKGLISMIFEGDYGPVNAQIKEPLNDVANSTERLIDLVNDMLDVSRIEAGRLKFQLSEFDPNKVIEEIIRSLQPVAKQKKINLISKDLVTATVQADVDKVKQVLSNLIGNSLKFTDKGGIEIHTVLNRSLLNIYVADSGIGISLQEQKKLFAKFQQISTQQEGRPQGSGLGLYISQQIAKKMGGDLWIEKSELGKGAIFVFSLPLAKSEIASKVEGEMKKEVESKPDQK